MKKLHAFFFLLSSLAITTWLLSIPLTYSANTNINSATKTTIQCGDGTTNLPGCNSSLGNPSYYSEKFIPRLIPGFIAFAGAMGVIMLMVAGVRYLVSMGNDDQVKKAEKMMLYTLLGIGFSLIAYIIVQIIINLEF